MKEGSLVISLELCVGLSDFILSLCQAPGSSPFFSETCRVVHQALHGLLTLLVFLGLSVVEKGKVALC